MLILSSSLILSGCYSSRKLYFINSVTSNYKETANFFEVNSSKPVSITYLKSKIVEIIEKYAGHGYPFVTADVSIKSKHRMIDVNITIDKGPYVVINGVYTNLKEAYGYLNAWGRDIAGKSYDENKVRFLCNKVGSLSFATIDGDFKIVKSTNGYSLFCPIKSVRKSFIKGNFSYNNQIFEGKLSYSTNSLFRKSGNINLFYDKIGSRADFIVNASLKNIGYSDFDINLLSRYSTVDTSDYLVNGEISINYRSYNKAFFSIGIGLYQGISSGLIKYVFVKNSMRGKIFSALWYMEANKRGESYYTIAKGSVDIDYNFGNLALVSLLSGEYMYPSDSLPVLMQNDLCGFSGVRGYKSMMYHSVEFMMLRNDLLYSFNNLISAGLIFDFAVFSKSIYSFGVSSEIHSDKSSIKIDIAVPGWKEWSSLVISGEISYAF